MYRNYSYFFCLFISVYDILTGKIVTKLEGHRQCVRDVSWHPYENTLVTTSVIYSIFIFILIYNISMKY